MATAIGYCHGVSSDFELRKDFGTMAKYVCDVCGWEYDEAVGDPEQGIEPGTPFDALGDAFVCPLCGVDKDHFSKDE